MDFSLTEEQILLRESVEKYIADHGGVERHRKLSAASPGYEPAAWQAIAELGWLALPFTEEDGGLGGSATDLMVMCESLGKGLVREPFLHTAVTCGGLLAQAGSESQRAAYIPALVEGSSQWAFAFAEQGSGFDFTAIDTTATASSGGFAISGSKRTVLNGAAADYLILTALAEPGDPRSLSLFLLPVDQPGLQREPFVAVDGSHGAHVTLNGAEAELLGEVGNGDAVIAAALDRSLVALGAESVGAMQVLLDATVEYCKTREQFGQPIGKFQALQHRMADMYLKLEESRSLLYDAAIQLQEGSDAAPAACAALKVKIAEAGRFIAHESVQLHGGIGMTDELIVSHLLKRLLLLSKLYGDENYYLERYIKLQAA